MSVASRPSSSHSLSRAAAGRGRRPPTARRSSGSPATGAARSSSTPRCPAGQTLLRALKSRSKVSTRYGGGFVQSIEGVEGSARRHRGLVLVRERPRRRPLGDLLSPPRRRRRVVGLPRLVGRRRDARGRRRRLSGAVPARLRRRGRGPRRCATRPGLRAGRRAGRDARSAPTMSPPVGTRCACRPPTCSSS